MNVDEGTYQLCNLYDQLIQRASLDGKNMGNIKIRDHNSLRKNPQGCEFVDCEMLLLKIVSVDFSREVII